MSSIATIAVVVAVASAAAAANAAMEQNKAMERQAKEAQRAREVNAVQLSAQDANAKAKAARAYAKFRASQIASIGDRNAFGGSASAVGNAALAEGYAAQTDTSLNTYSQLNANDAAAQDLINRSKAGQKNAFIDGGVGGLQGLQAGISLGSAVDNYMKSGDGDGSGSAFITPTK